jgi:adenosylhomocysteine nucleosidase
MSHPLILFALEEEAQALFADYTVSYCGVGKLNAAYRLACALAAYQAAHDCAPPLVLNLGSAGSPRFTRGSVVNCTRFIQRDFDVTALGLPPYTTPFDAVPALLDNGMAYDGLPTGTCGSGDNFATATPPDAAWDVVDMEAYALAKVCFLENIPFACLKYITDGADGQAATAWQDGLPATAAALLQAVKTHI